ncbi:MAG: ABC transporter permease subunit [Chloroflexota bacterium]
MRNVWTIARREYNLYFMTPIAYAVSFMLLLILGVLFYLNLQYAMSQLYAPGIQIVLGPLVFLLLFATPAITMRLLADEHRMGTIELLLTSPVRDWELVVGKWLGGWLFLLTIVAITWIYPLILNQLVDPGIDQGPLITGYLGIVLISAALVAIGVAVSSLFNNQIAVYFVNLGLLLVLWMLMASPQSVGGGSNELLNYLNFRNHFYDTFYAGIIDVQDVVYYLSITALSLFLGSVSVETRRWR